MSDNTLKIYTDGACSRNGTLLSMGGIGIFCEEFFVSEKFPYNNPTNQRAELLAILTAIEMLIEENLLEKYENICIFSDSMYSINCCTKWIHKWINNDWKVKNKQIKNREFIEPIYKYLQKYQNIELKHIKAHTNKTDEDSIGNRKADNLAVSGIKNINNN